MKKGRIILLSLVLVLVLGLALGASAARPNLVLYLDRDSVSVGQTITAMVSMDGGTETILQHFDFTYGYQNENDWINFNLNNVSEYYWDEKLPFKADIAPVFGDLLFVSAGVGYKDAGKWNSVYKNARVQITGDNVAPIQVQWTLNKTHAKPGDTISYSFKITGGVNARLESADNSNQNQYAMDAYGLDMAAHKGSFVLPTYEQVGEISFSIEVIDDLGQSMYVSSPNIVISNTEWKMQGGNWYLYENGKMLTGFQNVGYSTYYFNPQGIMQKGWFTVGKDWYYSDDQGKLNEETNPLINGKFYGFDSQTHAMITGWQKIEWGGGKRTRTLGLLRCQRERSLG